MRRKGEKEEEEGGGVEDQAESKPSAPIRKRGKGNDDERPAN